VVIVPLKIDLTLFPSETKVALENDGGVVAVGVGPVVGVWVVVDETVFVEVLVGPPWQSVLNMQVGCAMHVPIKGRGDAFARAGDDNGDGIARSSLQIRDWQSK